MNQKELFEHLEVLGQATEGTPAEASFDYLVDSLLRVAVGSASRRSFVAGTIGRWQAIYRPLHRAEQDSGE